MRWSERADKKDKRKQSKCVKRVGTAICTARSKNGQIHYPVVLLDTKYIYDSLTYLTGIIIHVFTSLNNEEKYTIES